MHGRHLFLGTSNCFVDLDCGIDFLKSGKVRVDCAITFAKMNDEKEAFRRSYNPVRFMTVASNGMLKLGSVASMGLPKYLLIFRFMENAWKSDSYVQPRRYLMVARLSEIALAFF